jgi:hypothetical protein
MLINLNHQSLFFISDYCFFLIFLKFKLLNLQNFINYLLYSHLYLDIFIKNNFNFYFKNENHFIKVLFNFTKIEFHSLFNYYQLFFF